MREKTKYITELTAIFILNILIVSLFSQIPASRAATYSYGSTGETVTKIQTSLKKWGYYTGNIDGIYGSKTTTAVKNFQRNNGLNVDGVAGPDTLAAIGINENYGSTPAYGDYDSSLYLLARIISAEARGEPYEGQVAVGAVVLNRVKHPSFPNSLSGVIYQNGAFTAIVDGQFDQPINSSAYSAARDALNGWDPSGGAIYYYNPAKATSDWIFSRQIIKTIGEHVFAI